MTGLRSFAICISLVLAGTFFLPAAWADEWDQMTKLSFNQAVEVPGVVLPAGTYWFVLGSSSTNRNMVQIFSEDWRTVYATVFTVPAYRQQVADQTELRFAERPHKRPEAILKWYYPGLITGHEFVYSRKEEKELVRGAKLDVVAQPTTT
jgi:hypothetical protein